jgi:hypothetical protein
VRYADPNGTATIVGIPNGCTDPLNPCDLATAIAGAQNGDEVIVRSGNYPRTSGTITDTAAIDLHGDFGGAPPEIDAGQNVGVALVIANPQSTVEYLNFVSQRTGGGQSTMLLFAGSVAEQIQARSTGIAGTCEVQAGVLRDSVCIATDAAGFPAEALEAGPAGNVAFRGDTLVQTAFGAGALFVNNTTANPLNVSVVSTILESPNLNSSILSQQATGAINVTIANSNLGLEQPNSTIDTITYTEVGGNQYRASYFPKFVNPTDTPVDGHPAWDFHQTPDAPTIDAGFLDPADLNTLDFERQGRVFGSAPDIGADEFTPPPPSGTTSTTSTTPPPPGTTTVPVTTVPPVVVPVVSRVSLKPARFAVKVKLKKGRRRRRGVRYGSSLRYSLSVPASVVGSVQAGSAGRVVGKACKKQTARNKRGHKACVLYKAKVVASLAARSAKVGVSSVAFTGKVGRKVLKPGLYRLRLVATDAGKHVSVPVFVAFQIVKG